MSPRKLLRGINIGLSGLATGERWPGISLSQGRQGALILAGDKWRRVLVKEDTLTNEFQSIDCRSSCVF